LTFFQRLTPRGFFLLIEKSMTHQNFKLGISLLPGLGRPISDPWGPTVKGNYLRLRTPGQTLDHLSGQFNPWATGLLKAF
jgi:hypothetical protein